MENRCDYCGKCCINTEMILSQQDIEKIIKFYPKKIKKKKFSFINQNGFFQLKNSTNHCVFLDNLSMKCTIYDFRPQGCRFYPLIYDIDEQLCKLDADCPRTHVFYESKQDFEKSCRNLKNFLREQLNLKLD